MSTRNFSRRALPALLVLVSACQADRGPTVTGPDVANVTPLDLSASLRALRLGFSEWTEPVPLGPPVSSASVELGGRLSPDELSLYFASDRPGGVGAIDIWVSRRGCRSCPWETPVNLGAGINSPGGDGNPILSPDGRLLFWSGARAGGQGATDLWMARRSNTDDDLAWGTAVNLGTAVNTPGAETSPSYALGWRHGPAINLYFSRDGDIHQAWLALDGTVSEPATPVTELNTPALDNGPSARIDGLELFFWSTRPGTGGADLWVATRRSLLDPWSPPVPVASLNTPGADLEPKLQMDGRTLIFAAGFNARPSLGNQDLWMSTRRLTPRDASLPP